MLKVFHSEKYPLELPEGHRFPFRKYELVREQLEHEGIISKANLHSPELASDEIIEWTHDPEYWSRAKRNDLSPREYRKIGFPGEPILVKRSLSSASSTLRAAEAALNDGAGMNLAGGTHHAYFDRGEGFCLLNDIAIASNALLNAGAVNKVLIVDLDVHQGNGTASIFEEDDRVFTFSMHCKENYPFKKEKSDLDLEVTAGSGDVTYLDLLRKHLPGIIERTNPEIVFYQAGVDILKGDRLGKLSVSMNGCYERDRFVISSLSAKRIPLVTVMGGGYAEKLPDMIKAHSNTKKLVFEHYESKMHFIP